MKLLSEEIDETVDEKTIDVSLLAGDVT